jgi:hypothetical protein
MLNMVGGTALFAMLLLAGCKSAQEKAQDTAIAQAKQQAAATGQAQQVVSTDKSGVTTTTVVQPPQPGQTSQQITTTTTSSQQSAAPGQPSAPAAVSQASAPVVSPVDVHIPAGTALAIRINQRISVKDSYAGERFSGELNDPIVQDGGNNVIVPRGTHVDGVIVESHRRGHFKGRSVLELRLVSMTLNGQVYALDTHANTRTKRGKGRRTGAFAGTGAGMGMLVGGIATGGVGLVVGGLIGGGGGALLGGATGNRDIVIPAESVVSFRLADDLVVQPA